MMNNVLFSKKSDQWSTPSNIYKWFMDHGYTDPCPLAENYIDFRNIEGSKYFINPPYSKIDEFIDYYITCVKPIVWLLPSRTGTSWFHKLGACDNCFILFIRGRLKFNDYGSAPFDSILVFQNCVYGMLKVGFGTRDYLLRTLELLLYE